MNRDLRASSRTAETQREHMHRRPIDDAFPLDEIAAWLDRHLTRLQPDFIVPIGHRISTLLRILTGPEKELCRWSPRVVQLAALHYVDLRHKSLLVIDEETEYCRKFRVDFLPAITGVRPKSVKYYTIFLKEGAIHDHRLEVKCFKSFDNDADFHSSIFAFTQFIKSRLDRPYNSDATLFKLSSDKVITDIQIETCLAKHGHLLANNDTTHTLFLPHLDFSASTDHLPGFRLLPTTFSPKLRIYRHGRSQLLASPMVFSPIEFEKTFFSAPNWPERFRDSPLLRHMLWAFHHNVQRSVSESYFFALYGIIRFWLEVILLDGCRSTLRLGGLDFAACIERSSCLSKYGTRMSKTLVYRIDDYLKRHKQEPIRPLTETSKRSIRDVEFDISDLLLIKSACLSEYKNSKVSFPSSTYARTGLSFDGIQRKTSIDPLTLSICLDTLCDNAWLKPFDKIEQVTANTVVVNRYYNTDTEEFIGLIVRFMRKARKAAIKITDMSLNKFMALVSYFILCIRNPKTSDPKIFCTIQGKVVKKRILIHGQSPSDVVLRTLLLDYYGHLFSRDAATREFSLTASPKMAADAEKHLSVTKREIFDPFVDLFVHIYKTLADYLKVTTIEDSSGGKRDIHEAFSGFVDLVGSRLPECGLRTVADLVNKGLWGYFDASKITNPEDRDRVIRQAKNLIFNSAPHKLRVLKSFSEAYLQIYAELGQQLNVYTSAIWKRMCVLPSSSRLIALFSKLIADIQLNLGRDKTAIEDIQKRTTPLLNVFLNIEVPRKLRPKDFVRRTNSPDWYVVSIDFVGSTDLGETYEERWIEEFGTEDFLICTVLAWAKYYRALGINLRGDESIVVLPTFKRALDFAASAWVHLTEITTAINHSHAYDYKTGCYARICLSSHDRIYIQSSGNYAGPAINRACGRLPKDTNCIIVDADSVDTSAHCLDGLTLEQGEVTVNGKTFGFVKINPHAYFDAHILTRFEGN